MSITIHRCAECNHKSLDHGYGGGWNPRRGPCSYGGCPCSLTPEHVEELNPPVEVPTFPAYTTGSAVWAKRAGS